jgi:WhiB family transcriptional regulator, redox-sensing transcriptional regulator
MSWRDVAACRGDNTGRWFAPDDSQDTRDAISICVLHCPSREACLAYALEAREGFGVWGGLSAAQLGRVRKGRPAGLRREGRAA